jgi:hypothetical protein
MGQQPFLPQVSPWVLQPVGPAPISYGPALQGYPYKDREFLEMSYNCLEILGERERAFVLAGIRAVGSTWGLAFLEGQRNGSFPPVRVGFSDRFLILSSQSAS